VVVAPALVPVRGAGGVSSWVEYQRASGRTPPSPGSPGWGLPAGVLLVPAAACALWGGRGGGGSGGSWWVGVVRGALLGPETTGPFVLVLVVLFRGVVGAGGGGVVSGFPASCRWSWSLSGAAPTSVWDVRVVV
jgi:hypothetical protein